MKHRVLILTLTIACHMLYGQGAGIAQQKKTAPAFDRIPALRAAPTVFTMRHIPSNLHTQHFGFFCRQELRMQQAGVSVAFRLGSMDLCNKLEDKPGYR